MAASRSSDYDKPSEAFEDVCDSTTPPAPPQPTLPSPVRPVIDTSRYNAFPQAARTRELTKAANTFASSGKNVFVHYVEPILEKRRARLLASGTAEKKFYKTAAQLWATVGLDEDFFWNEVAKEIRLCMKRRSLSVGDCLTFGGRAEDVEVCVRHAEVAVSAYLGTSLPVPMEEVLVGSAVTNQDASTTDHVSGHESIKEMLVGSACTTAPKEHDHDEEEAVISSASSTSKPEVTDETTMDLQDLLDVLPTPFQTDPSIIYGNFAHLDFTEIRRAEGRTQTMYLRRVAQMLDETGKELFHYYMVPRLCKTISPRPDGSTIVGISAGIWGLLRGERKAVWVEASRKVKGRLGDGDVEGLGVLDLGSGDLEVVRLHGFAEEDLEGYKARRGVRWEEK